MNLAEFHGLGLVELDTWGLKRSRKIKKKKVGHIRTKKENSEGKQAPKAGGCASETNANLADRADWVDWADHV